MDNTLKFADSHEWVKDNGDGTVTSNGQSIPKAAATRLSENVSEALCALCRARHPRLGARIACARRSPSGRVI